MVPPVGKSDEVSCVPVRSPDVLDQGDVPVLMGAVPVRGAVPLGAVPVRAVPVDAVPSGAVPRGAVPSDAVPNGAVPTGAVPIGAVPIGTVPVDPVAGAELLAVGSEKVLDPTPVVKGIL